MTNTFVLHERNLGYMRPIWDKVWDNRRNYSTASVL